MNGEYVKWFLKNTKTGLHVTEKVRAYAHNKIIRILRKYNAIDKSFNVDLSKIPLEEQKKILEIIESAISKYDKQFSPFPDKDGGFNIISLQKEKGLCISSYGTNHDESAKKITGKVIEVSYSTRVIPIDGSIVYKGDVWSNAAKIVKGKDVIGIMRYIQNDRKSGKEQIRADFEIDGQKIKVLSRYNATIPFLEMEIKCPPVAVEKGYNYFRKHEEKFGILTSQRQACN
jgi:hypothetical protein